MTQAKHTPSLWDVQDKWNVVAGKRLIANCGGYTNSEMQDVVSFENEANARLIATAPELLECLEALVECEWTQPADLQACQREARAVIAKATGQNAEVAA